MKGNFIVKAKPGSFNTFSTIMKLQQAFQRAKENEGGIIVQTRIASVTEWKLAYHKTLAILNAYNEMISGRKRTSSRTRWNCQTTTKRNILNVLLVLSNK